jgi:predicted SprT family Zn-dependent metalloprotease
MSNPLDVALRTFNSSHEMKKVQAIAELTLEQLNLKEELFPKLSILWNNRFTSRAGDAKVFKRPVYSELTTFGRTIVGFNYDGRVRLGTKYFSVSSEEQKLETIIHEVCHVASAYIHLSDPSFKSIKYDSHGFHWKELMAKVGYPAASPYHCTNTRQFKTFYRFKCPRCSHTGHLTAQMGGRIINQTTYKACRGCHLLIQSGSLKKIRGSDLVYQKV